MDKNNLKDAYDIGENMAVFSGEGRSYTIINKETGKTRQLVSEDGSLLPVLLIVAYLISILRFFLVYDSIEANVTSNLSVT
jgi:hypothetical protein